MTKTLAGDKLVEQIQLRETILCLPLSKVLSVSVEEDRRDRAVIVEVI